MKTQITTKSGNKGFSLVEIIIVVTILSILGTLGFISYSGYISKSRDSARAETMTIINNALVKYITTKTELPMPKNYVNVYNSGVLLGYQGYIDKDTLNKIGVIHDGKDPLNEILYTYYVNTSKSSFQLLGFMENYESKDLVSFVNNASASSYEKTIPVTVGLPLGVIIDNKNTPIQEVCTNDSFDITKKGCVNVSGNITKSINTSLVLTNQEILTTDTFVFEKLGGVDKNLAYIKKDEKDLGDTYNSGFTVTEEVVAVLESAGVTKCSDYILQNDLIKLLSDGSKVLSNINRGEIFCITDKNQLVYSTVDLNTNDLLIKVYNNTNGIELKNGYIVYNSDLIYKFGDKVYYNGSLYRVGWWQTGVIPHQYEDGFQMKWLGGEYENHIAGKIYPGDSIIKYNNSIYKAKWSTGTLPTSSEWTKIQ